MNEEYLKNFDKGFLLPNYNGYSLYNSVYTIFQLFGIKPSASPLNFDFNKFVNKNNKVVFFLIDGFGYNRYKNLENEIPFLKLLTEKGKVCPITSGFPSTTAASLATVATGLTPREHGLFEWNLYFDELDEVIQTIPFSSMGRRSREESLLERGIDPRILINKDKIFKILGENGIKSYTFYNQLYINSVFSKLISDGANKIDYRYLSDLIVLLEEYIFKEKGSAFFYVYWPGVDTEGHKYGPDSEQYALEAKIFFQSIYENLISKSSKDDDIIFAMTSDHGQVTINPKETVYLNKDRRIRDAFKKGRNGNKILPWGNVRDVFLWINDEEREGIIKYIQNTYGRLCRVLKTEEAVGMGLFGDNGSEFLQRLGNVILLPYKGNTIWYEHVKGELVEYKGHHGGLTEDEMKIPFALASFNDLI
ncbi:MAG: alkaline phosphatase family protein [Patescibacteria group bacterium]|nr:alkaline phosphatase family protein [Patescibacteria group bacterium]